MSGRVFVKSPGVSASLYGAPNSPAASAQTTASSAASSAANSRLRRQKAIKCFIRGSLTVYQPSQIMSLAFTMDASSTVAR